MSIASLPPLPDPGAEGVPGLSERIVGFVRTLRAAGLPLGVGRSALALEAARRVDIGNRAEFSAALRSVLTAGPAEGVLFDCAFPMFFGNPDAFARLGELQAQGLRSLGESKPPPGALRLLRAMENSSQLIAAPGVRRAVAGVGYSPQESLSAKDFGQMSPEEQAQAQELLRRGVFCPTRPGRRFRPAAHGPRIDFQATLRAGLASGGELMDLRRKARRQEPMELVLLFDVSGSMTSYARMALHFAHALCSTRRNVEVFVFATRLTRVTRELRARDGDVATAAALKAAPDWEGGTRIASALSEFNRLWSRRVLARRGWFCCSAMAWSGHAWRSCAPKPGVCADRASGWCGSTRCWATRASSRARAVCGLFCRPSTSTARPTT